MTISMSDLPRPMTGPVLNVARFAMNPLRALEHWERFGQFVHVPMVGNDFLLLRDPEHIAEMLRDREGLLRKDAYTRELSRVLGQGLLTSEGEPWRAHRQLAAHAFTPKRIKGYTEKMVQRAAALVDRARPGETIDLHKTMFEVTLEIVGDTLFDADVSGDAASVGHSLEVISDFFATSLEAYLRLPHSWPTPGAVRLRRATEVVDGVLDRIVRERTVSGRDHGDLLSALLKARDERGRGLPPRQVRDEAITLFLAGHETTAITLANAFYLLARHPFERAKLERELDEVLEGRLPTADDVPRLVRADRIVTETMRLYPTVWSMGREMVAEGEFCGVRVPAGTQIIASQWLVHRSERFYEAPLRFIPDRWSDGLEKRLPKFAYFPFGGGSRICIGNHFAKLEAILVLATVAQRVRLDVGRRERLWFRPSVTLRPAKPVSATVTPRRAPSREERREAAHI
jgi:cytochrome P450